MSYSIIDSLYSKAKKSQLPYGLAAAIIKGKRMVGPPQSNQVRNICRNKICASQHAEVGAVLAKWGKDISWTEDKGWCHAKVAKGEKEGKYTKEIWYMCY